AGDALSQLSQLVPCEKLAQLGLTDENDLQQLACVGFEVGEEANLLEHRGCEVLCLVHYDDDTPAAGVGAQQIAAENVDEILEALRRRIGHTYAEFLADGQEE